MSRRRKLKTKIYEIEIESLSHEGRGISHIDNKVIFTRGALPGEKVVASRTLSRAKYEEADVVEIIIPHRIELNQSAQYTAYVAAAHFNTCRVIIKSMQKMIGFKAPFLVRQKYSRKNG